MMILQSAKPVLAMILMLVPLVIGAAILLKNLAARKQRGDTLPVGEASPERKTHHSLGIMEGISFLLLMFVAMPLKKATGDGTWVTIVGSLHGALFLLYGAAVLFAVPVMKWRPLTTLLALAASIVPFGTFALEWFLKRQATTTQTATEG